MQPIRILGIAGSLRARSFNKALLEVARQTAPEGVTVETFDLNGIPVFSEDLEKEMPPRVVELKAAIRAADAILFATPEYNYSIPGALKNAIDWASRPYGDGAWDGKPVGIMGASLGPQGTARAQYHLRQVLVSLNMHPLNRPEVMVGSAAGKFDAAGELTDAKSREMVARLVAALAEWTRRLGRGS